MSDRVQITVFPDGPYEVSNAGSAAFCGNAIPVEGPLYICRCGNSQNAPFCDGSHRTTGFVGTSEPQEQREPGVWEGQRIRTVYNPNACMHVGYCTVLKELRPREEAGEPQAAEAIAQAVARCPSGALRYEAKGPLPEPPPNGGAAIDIQEGGELRVQAPFDINAPLQLGQTDDKATLCRCGMSKNKPWCDGRHRGRRGFV